MIVVEVKALSASCLTRKAERTPWNVRSPVCHLPGIGCVGKQWGQDILVHCTDTLTLFDFVLGRSPDMKNF